MIPVVGSLVRRTVGLDPASGFTSYAEIAGMVDAAISDPSVEGILLDIDSPGGEAGGVFELGERLRAADAVKPIWAVASDAAYSAAYAIGCAASRLVVTRTGGVGSIGVIAMHASDPRPCRPCSQREAGGPRPIASGQAGQSTHARGADDAVALQSHGRGFVGKGEQLKPNRPTASTLM